MRCYVSTSVLALLLVLVAVVPTGCAPRQTIEAHTLLRDSVTLAVTDTASFHWQYRVETTYIRDTLRSVIETGDVTTQQRVVTHIDSVTVVRYDTIQVAAPSASSAPHANLWRRGANGVLVGLLIAGVVVFCAWLYRRR